MFSRVPLFDVIYDWDDGTWTAIVRESGGVIIAKRVGFELDTDAEESLAELRMMLVKAPEGDVSAVLSIWEKMGS